jgi:hypothetical protein
MSAWSSTEEQQKTTEKQEPKIEEEQQVEDEGTSATTVLKYMERRLMSAFLSQHEKDRLVATIKLVREEQRLETAHQQIVSTAAWAFQKTNSIYSRQHGQEQTREIRR